MDEDQELLDRFAIAAMEIISPDCYVYGSSEPWGTYADECWGLAIAMKQARDRIFMTAKPAQPDPGPFPPIDLGMIPGTGANHPFEPFEYTERN